MTSRETAAEIYGGRPGGGRPSYGIARDATPSETIEAEVREANKKRQPSVPLVEDIADRVLHSPGDKLRSHRDTRSDRQAMLRNVMDKKLAAHDLLQKWEGRFKQLNNEHLPPGDDHTAVLQAKAEIESATTNLARLTEREQDLTASWHASARLVTEEERYLINSEPGGIRLSEADPSPLKPGEKALEALDRASRRTRTLQADYQQVLAKLFPTSVAKKLFRDQMAERIEMARPDVSPLLESLEPIDFRLKRVPVSQYGGSAAAIYAVDPIGFLAWLFPDEFFAAIDREIDSEGDDPNAMSIEQRRAKLKQIDGDILASERDEAHFAELAGLLPRSDIDPRASLGLADDMPAPKRV
jgi:hypothetical protein